MSLLKKLNLFYFMDGTGAGAAVVDAGAAGGGDGAGGEGGTGGGGAGTGSEGTDTGAGGGEGGEGGGEGGGAGSGKGAGGSGDGGRTDETPEAKIQREADEAAESTRQREEDEQLFERDGRKVDDKTKKTIAGLKKVNPIAAKALADEYFHRKAYMEQFPTVQEARAARAVIESLGGVKGIEEAQTELNAFRTEITQLQKGDKELITGLYKSDPQGIVMAGQNILELLRTTNPEQYQETILPEFKHQLDQSGVVELVDRAMKLLTEAKGQDAYNMLGNILKWDQKMAQGLTQRKTSRDALTPEKKAFDEKVAKFETKQAEAAENDYASTINDVNNKNISRQVDPFFNEMALPNDGRKAFLETLYKSVWNAIKEDGEFQAVHGRIKASGDKQRRVDFVTEKFKDLLPDHFLKIRNALYPSYKPRRGAPPPKKDQANGAGKGNGAGAGGGGGAATDWKTVSEAPHPTKVDQSKTTDMMMVQGRYILKDGTKLLVR